MGKYLFNIIIPFLFKVLARVKVSGVENFPSTDSCVLVCNHLGIIDGGLILYLKRIVKRNDMIVPVAKKYQKHFLMRWAVKSLDLLWLDRNLPDVSTLKEVIRRINRGGVLTISPEGTRSPTGTLIQGKPGAAFWAAKTKVPIVPSSVVGTENEVVKKSLLNFKPIEISVSIGEPFTIPELPKKNTERERFLQQYTDEIMCRIAALLPTEYRGVYKEHPRLLELLEIEGTEKEK
jgi:1-acyl-sn-glycerol-3-phosphate acyltransferase